MANEQMKEHNRRQRWIILLHYGGNPPKCACCGETYIEFLSIDHIHGGGLRHRESLGGGGKYRNGGKRYDPRRFYKWLIENNFPEGFRVLCMNCNTSLGHYGYCPHSGKTQEKPNNTHLEVIIPEKWIGSPSEKIKKKQIRVSGSSIEYCRNCGGQFRSSGTVINQYGFCRKGCHDEWREKERQRLNLR